MAFKVRRSTIAIRQFNEILDYWNKNNGSTIFSQKKRLKVKSEEDRISSFPFLGKATSSNELRFIIIESNYLLYYSIQNKVIIIIGFFDTRQDPEFINSSLEGS
jgi:hypothetical protein